MTQYETLDWSLEGGVATIRLRRPERLNAINALMYDEIVDAFGRAGEDGDVRVLRLAGTGDRAFCAGADQAAEGSERPHDPARTRERDTHPERGLNARSFGFEKPMIAAINGVAVGGGLALALSADVIIAADTATFATAHVKLALPLVDLLGFLLPRRVGPGRAAEMAFTNRLVGAPEALAIGLIERVVPADRLEEESAAMADLWAKQPPLALRFSKLAIRKGLGEDFEGYLSYDRYLLSVGMRSEDAKEAVRAKRAGRPPEFTGR